MLLRWLFAALHLLALGIGLGAVWARARALGGPLDDAGLRRVFAADTFWGLAAVLWITTGLARLFSTMEKGTAYYVANHAFWTKMALLGLVLALEVWPAVTLVRWRRQLARGEAPDIARAPTFATISTVQALLVVGMVLAATAMARGIGMLGR
jgi:putative membrane protein